MFGNVTIAAGEYKLIELIRVNGEVSVIEPKGNFDSYNPETSDELSVKGFLGGQALTLSYDKENVCGEPKLLQGALD